MQEVQTEEGVRTKFFTSLAWVQVDTFSHPSSSATSDLISSPANLQDRSSSQRGQQSWNVKQAL